MVDCQGGDGTNGTKVAEVFAKREWNSAFRMLDGDVANLLRTYNDNEYLLSMFGADTSGDFIRCLRRTLRLLYESYGV